MIKPFEIDYPLNTFIGAWYIDSKICDKMLEYCKDNIHLKEKKEINNDGTIYKKSSEWPIMVHDYHYPIKYYKDALKLVVSKYCDKWKESTKTQKFLLRENFNIQEYEPGEGFYEWHCENSGKFDYEILRHLVFMTYLNDVPDGGTEFLHQNITLPAKKGLTVVWPSAWTHTHRGIISNTHKKVIITGWLSFQT